MKSFQFVCVFALVAVAACVPVDKKSKNPDAEVVMVPLEGPQDVFDLDDGVVDTGYPGPYFFNPFGNPFSGFMTGMDDMMKRLHDQMSQVLHRLPVDNGDWKEVGEGKGNTTSTTKVINGHRVTVNETTYGDDGKDSGSFFKIRIVDVRPASEESSDSSEEKVDNRHDVEEVNTKEVEDTTPKNTRDNGSPELVEANEIPRGKPENNLLDNEVATFGEDFSMEGMPENTFLNSHMPLSQLGLSDLDMAVPLPDIESNDVNIPSFDLSNDIHIVPFDLSNDININQMMADQGAPHHPDAEVFDVNDKQKSYYQYNVNHPDAEVFDVNDKQQPYYQYNVERQQDPNFYIVEKR